MCFTFVFIYFCVWCVCIYYCCIGAADLGVGVRFIVIVVVVVVDIFYAPQNVM